MAFTTLWNPSHQYRLLLIPFDDLKRNSIACASKIKELHAKVARQS